MSEQNKTAFPLCWPPGWPVTGLKAKEDGKFKASLSGALNNLKSELARLGGLHLVLSSNYTLGSERPAESGVVAYFQLNGQPIAIPCDRWKLVEHNVQAIALTIEAMRGMDRWGAKHMITAMFSGFKALPASTGESLDPCAVLGVSMSAGAAEIREAYRVLVKKFHPDNQQTGDAERFQRVQRAYEMMMATGVAANS